MPIVLWITRLYANSSKGKCSSHEANVPCTTARSIEPKVLFTASVWPSVCGWHEVENNFVPSLPHNSFQKWLRNFGSLSLTMVWRIPCNLITCSTNKDSTLGASSHLWHGMKWAIFENWSTMTKMLSLPLLVLGKFKTRSIEISSQGLWGVGRGVYKPWERRRDLAPRHSTHWPQIQTTSLCILGK